MDKQDFLMDNISTSVASFDTNCKLLYFNKSFAEKIKDIYSIRVSIGLDIELFSQEKQEIEKLFKIGLEGKDIEVVRKLGKHENYFILRIRSLKNNEGNIIGLVNEIIEMNTEVNIAQSIIDNTEDLIAAVDRNFRFILLNNSFKREFSNLYNTEFHVGMNLVQLAKVLDTKKIISLYEQAFAGEKFSIVEKIGTNYYIIRYSPLVNNKGEIIGASQTATNISNRVSLDNSILELNEQLSEKLQKANQNAIESKHTLHKLNEKLQLILEAAEIAVWTWDIKKDIVTSDRNYRILYGFPEIGDIKAKDVFQSVHPEDIGQVKRDLEKCLSETGLINSNFRVVRSDGRIRWIAGKGKMYRDEEGNPEEVIGVNWDISENIVLQNERLEALKDAELSHKKRAEEAENNKKHQEEFINTICHEVRNPLNGLIGVTSLLSDELNELRDILSKVDNFTLPGLKPNFFSKVDDYIKTLEACSEQQKFILDDVLDLSKLENHKITIHNTPCDLKLLVKNVTQMFSGKMTEKRLQCKTTFPDEDIWIKTDQHRLSQILINLVSNAIKFTEFGEIKIEVAAFEISNEEYKLYLSVQDSGIGMTNDEVKNLFQNFWQADATNVSGGTGLGLVIAKRLLGLMKGEINVTSEKWKGSKFEITLICEKSDRTVKSLCEKKIESIDNSQDKVILIVEDNIVNQKILKSYLEKKGISSQIASNGIEALERCKSYQFSLIFMDIEMPLMNGLEATNKIRKEKMNLNSTTPIIGLSGYSMKKQIADATEVGMNEYMTKPYHKDDVYKIIDKYFSL